MAPASRHACSTRAASSSTAAGTPSTSSSSSAAVPAGASERTPRFCATASSDSPSISSSAAGTTRARVMLTTAATAASIVGERRAQRRLECRAWHQAEDYFGDDRQRAFRAHQQLRQVVTDDVLHRLAAGPDNLPGRKHRLEAEHIALRRAVLEGARAAGALRDVAAERAQPQRRRIGRIEETDLLDRVLQVSGDDVRLDDRQQVGLVDFQDAVHPLERQHHAAARRHRAAGVAGAGAARHERHAVLVAQRRDRRHLMDVRRQDDGVSRRATLQRIGAVGDEGGGVGEEMLRADDGAEGVDEGRGKH